MKAYIAIPGLEKNPHVMARLATIATTIDAHRGPDRPGEDELESIVQRYDVVIVGVKEKMTARVFRSASRVRYLCTLSSGTDHISEEFFSSGQVRVINAPTANAPSVAEFALAYILSQLKDFIGADRAFRSGLGRAGLRHLPYELGSRTIGVVGAGRIASCFLKLAGCFGPRKLAWTFHPEKHQDLCGHGVEFTTLEQLCTVSDFVLIAVPASDRTANLIDSERLKMMKRSACILNLSRMSVMDVEAFVQELEKGRFSGSMLDCFPEEVSIDTAGYGRLTLTPHIAGLTRESQLRMADEVIDTLCESVHATGGEIAR